MWHTSQLSLSLCCRSLPNEKVKKNFEISFKFFVYASSKNDHPHWRKNASRNFPTVRSIEAWVRVASELHMNLECDSVIRPSDFSRKWYHQWVPLTEVPKERVTNHNHRVMLRDRLGISDQTRIWCLEWSLYSHRAGLQRFECCHGWGRGHAVQMPGVLLFKSYFKTF